MSPCSAAAPFTGSLVKIAVVTFSPAGPSVTTTVGCHTGASAKGALTAGAPMGGASTGTLGTAGNGGGGNSPAPALPSAWPLTARQQASQLAAVRAHIVRAR